MRARLSRHDDGRDAFTGPDDPARRSDAVDVQALPNDPAKPKSSFPAISTDVYKAARKHADTLLASLVNESTPSVPHPSRAIPAGPCKQARASLASRPAPEAARQKRSGNGMETGHGNDRYERGTALFGRRD